MKLWSLLSAAQSIAPALRQRLSRALLSVIFTLPLVTSAPVLAAERILQVLGACDRADAQYVGNRKHGRTELTSFQPSGDAGVLIEGVEGKTISQLATVVVEFEPPATAGSSTFILRIKVEGLNGDRVQRFTIGPDTDPDLPNLPTRPVDGNRLEVQIPRNALLDEKSKLKLTDKITKYAFLFSTTKTNSTQVQHIDHVFYAGSPIYVVLEPLTCNLR